MLSRMILSVATFAFLTVGVIADEQGKDKDKDDKDEERTSRLVPLLENGDMDGNGNRNITDAVRLLNYLFSGGEPPVHAMCQLTGSNTYVPTEVENGDIDGSGSTNITDAMRFVSWLFASGDAPVPLGCDK